MAVAVQILRAEDACVRHEIDGLARLEQPRDGEDEAVKGIKIAHGGNDVTAIVGGGSTVGAEIVRVRRTEIDVVGVVGQLRQGVNEVERVIVLPSRLLRAEIERAIERLALGFGYGDLPRSAG